MLNNQIGGIQNPVDRRISSPVKNPVARFFKGAWREIRKNWGLMLMALPAVAVVFIVCYMPMPGIILAFKNYKPGLGIWGSQWTGLKNFQFLFNSGRGYHLPSKAACCVSQFSIYHCRPGVWANHGIHDERDIPKIHCQNIPILPVLSPFRVLGAGRLFYFCFPERRQWFCQFRPREVWIGAGELVCPAHVLDPDSGVPECLERIGVFHNPIPGRHAGHQPGIL